MTFDAVIIGGGVAGLSAAVDLSSRGARILLLEQKPHLGGRTYSFIDKVTGDSVDNGQHLLMGCYHATRRYLHAIGSDHLASLQPNLTIDFLRPGKELVSLKCPPLPAPLHVLVGLLRLRTVPLSHRLRLLRIGAELLDSSIGKERELAELTVDQWLRSQGQTEENRKYLWDILAVGTLNDDPATVSALLFYRVLRASFLGMRENSSLLIPRVGLSDLLVDPAVKFLESRGSEVRASADVTSFDVKGGRVEAVRLDGKRISGGAYICAIPYYALLGMKRDAELVRGLDRFASSPIITVHCWFDRQVFDREFAAALDSTIQWVFNRTRMLGGSSNGRQYLSLVISGAGKQIGWSKEKLVAMAVKELSEVLPDSRSAKLVHSLVIKEKRATFSPTPGVEESRPPAGTGFSNFFLAGDWTNTGYPATIEGAVISGVKAAGQIL